VFFLEMDNRFCLFLEKTIIFSAFSSLYNLRKRVLSEDFVGLNNYLLPNILKFAG